MRFLAGVLLLSMSCGCKSERYFDRSESVVRADLQKRFPLGSTKDYVLGSLRQEGLEIPVDFAGEVRADPDGYPPTKVGGDAFLEVHLAEANLPLATDRTAFFIFSGRRLVEITLRTETDAP